MFDALAGELAGPAAAALTAFELEELLEESGREVIRQLLQDHCDLRKMREEPRKTMRPPDTAPAGNNQRNRDSGTRVKPCCG
jgi:hypothetical protein